jgi:hypothetical protein
VFLGCFFLYNVSFVENNFTRKGIIYWIICSREMGKKEKEGKCWLNVVND